MTGPRVAVVGMGGYAGHHRRVLRDLAADGRAVYAAQVAPPFDHVPFAGDLAALRAAGTAVYDSLRQLLAAERRRLDLVCVPTGIPLHRAMATAVLEAGCNVLVEKPAAGAIQDVDAIVATARRTGGLAAVGYQQIYYPWVHQLKAWLLDGRFGALRRVRGFGCWPRDAAYYARNGWAGRLATGDTWVLDGPHNNALAHSVNLLCFLAGAEPMAPARPASIRAELYRARPLESADTAALRVQTAQGVEVFFAVSHATEESLDPGYAVDTDAACLEFGFYGGVAVRWHDGRVEAVLPADARDEARSVAAVVSRLAGDASAPVCTLEIARAQTLCACGSFESAPIRDVPEGLRRDGPNGAIAVRGMTQAVRAAFAAGSLFSELGLDWAHPGDEIDLEGYRYFPTFRDPTLPPAQP